MKTPFIVSGLDDTDSNPDEDEKDSFCSEKHERCHAQSGGRHLGLRHPLTYLSRMLEEGGMDAPHGKILL
jgi:hypothetical protein